MTPAEEKIPTIIRNEFFYAFARLCMVLLTVVAVPLAGFTLHRMVNTADEIRTQLQAQNVALQILSSEVRYRFSSVEDHEHRLRKLELGSSH